MRHFYFNNLFLSGLMQ